jgi:nicotinate-nucleotide adenylyltransferase
VANKLNSVCLYFGTFNPVHTGHLMIAQAALNQFSLALGVRSVVFIPAANPPHRLNEPDLLDACDRLKLLELATADHPGFEVNDIELQRTGPSYTVDTVRALAAQNKIQLPVPIIIGSDALAQLASWHEPESLADMACFLQIPRPGYAAIKQIEIPVTEKAAQPGVMPTMQTLSLNTHSIEMPTLSLSASWLRKQLKHHTPETKYSLRYFLPDPVWQYIQTHNLYS